MWAELEAGTASRPDCLHLFLLPSEVKPPLTPTWQEALPHDLHFKSRFPSNLLKKNCCLNCLSYVMIDLGLLISRYFSKS